MSEKKTGDRHSPDKVQMLVRFPREMRQDLDVVSTALGISATEGVNRAVEAWLEEHRFDSEVLGVISRFAQSREQVPGEHIQPATSPQEPSA